MENRKYDMSVWIQVSGGSTDTQHSTGPSPSLVALDRYCKEAMSIWDNGLESSSLMHFRDQIRSYHASSSHIFQPHQDVLLRSSRSAGKELLGQQPHTDIHGKGVPGRPDGPCCKALDGSCAARAVLTLLMDPGRAAWKGGEKLLFSLQGLLALAA